MNRSRTRSFTQETTSAGALLKNVSATFSPSNQILSSQTQLPNGSLATRTFQYDNNGNLVSESASSQTKLLSWNAQDRLQQVTMPNGAIHSYGYDANGLRVRKDEAGIATAFILDGQTVLHELDSNNESLTSLLTNPQVIDETLVLLRDGVAYWPLTDAVGSIVGLADSSGALVSNASYDVNGVRSVTGPGPALSFGFTGREHDASGLRYHRDRYVNPEFGNWVQPDRLGLTDGPNTYLYAHGQPTQVTDALGLFSTAVALEFVIPLMSGIVSAFSATLVGLSQSLPGPVLATSATLAFIVGFASALPFPGAVASLVAGLALGVVGNVVGSMLYALGSKRPAPTRLHTLTG